MAATLEAAELHIAPYHIYVPSFGEWGYVLAAAEQNFRLPEKISVPTRFLNPAEMAAMFRFPPDMARINVEPNYLNSQKLVAYFEEDWANVMR